MNAIYPSKSFLIEARKALNAHEVFEVSVLGGWRGKVLAKEVEAWPAIAEGAKISEGPWKPPSIICNLLMMPLLTIHYAALSARYEMRSKVSGHSVVLTYFPL